MKRQVSFFLALILIIYSWLPNVNITAASEIVDNTEMMKVSKSTGYAETAETSESDESSEIEVDYVYFSDLFWVYPRVLKYVYLPDYRYDTFNAFTEVRNEYINTPDYHASAIEHKINVAVDKEEWIKLVCDQIGISNFEYNDELDKANVIFASELAKIDLDSYKKNMKGSKYLKNAKSLLEVIKEVDELRKNLEISNSNLEPVDIFTYLYEGAYADLGKFCPELETHFGQLNIQVQDTIKRCNKTLDGLSDVVDIVNSLVYFMVVHETDMEIIDDVLSTQPKDSTLYKGLSRFKQQQQESLIKYLTTTFIEDKGFDAAAKIIDKFIEEAIVSGFQYDGKLALSMYDTTTAIVKLLNDVVFDWLWKVDYSEYTSAFILSHYVNDFYDSLVTKIEEMENNCTVDTVQEFKKLVNAYVAATRAALEASKKLAERNAKYGGEYTVAWLELQTGKYCIDGVYDIYINLARNYLRDCSQEERKTFMREPYELTGGLVTGGTDDPIAGHIYTVPEQEFSKINLGYNTTLKILEDADIIVLGDAVLGDCAILQNYGKLKICGNMNLNGDMSPYTTFDNNGTTEIVGDLVELQSQFAMNRVSALPEYAEDSILYVGGDINFFFKQTYDNKKGLLVLNGDEPQHLSNLSVYNMDVQNPSGIVLDRHMYVYGPFKLNGNPSDAQKFWMFIYNGAKFDDVSVYPNALITQSFNLWENVTFAELAMSNASSFQIGTDISLRVEGNFCIGYGYVDYTNNDLNRPNTTGSRTWGPFTASNFGDTYIGGNLIINNGYAGSYAKLSNNGTITVKGNIKNNNNKNYITSQRNNSILCVAGNIDLAKPTDYQVENGILILNGDTLQNITLSTASDLYIENESKDGVNFLKPISITHLFDHKGNQFSLLSNGSGSSFVDFDGDGMLDHVDQQPTVGNACIIKVQSENEEYGTVSVPEITALGGSEITISATPTDRYQFSKWIDDTGATVSTNAEYTFTVTSSETLTAVFIKRSRFIDGHWAADGGWIEAPFMAQIDSEVSVQVWEFDGYYLEEGSLCFNGVPIEDNTFIMPNEDVILSAVFIRNEAFFALSEKIDEAKGYTSESYSAQSYKNLQTAISNAEAALVNKISSEDSGKHISLIQAAVEGLEDRPVDGHVCKDNLTYVSPKDPTCTEFGAMAHYACSCGKTYSDAAATAELTGVALEPLGHNGKIVAGFEPTCTMDGKTDGKTCVRCDKILAEQETIPALGHDTVIDQAVAPTCTATGLTEGSHCSRCSAVLKAQETLPATGHAEEILPKLEPTCTSVGLTEGKNCSVCGEILAAQETIVALGHTEVVDEAVDATCKATGLTEGIHCAVCNTILVAQTVVEKLPHTEETIPAVDPTCTTTGLTEGKKCSACGEILIAQEEISTLDHNEEAIPGVDPTCTAEGKTEGKKCSTCGTTILAQKVIPALGHIPETVPGYSATCTEPGLTDGEKCGTCGTVTKEQTVVPATGHAWDNGVCTNCSKECEHSYEEEGGSCTICGSGCAHEYESTVTKPTCTAQGYTAYTCTICGNAYNGDYVDVLGHDWLAATCTAPKTCSRCGATEGEANGHNYGSVVTAPSCTDQGYTIHTCSACGHSFTDSETAALGHIPGTPMEENRKEPTCTEEGSYETAVYCTTCNAELSREKGTLPADGHGYTDSVTVPTCTDQGYTTHTCKVCGDVTVDNYTPATGHSYGEWIVITEATCTAEGEQRRICENCDHYESEAIPALEHDWNCDTCDRCGESKSPYKVELTLADNSTDSVWVDGKEYPVTKTANGIRVELADENATNLVIYSYNDPDTSDAHTQYPIGMRVWLLSYEDGYITTYVSEFDNLLQYSGSSIRVTGKKGIRMITSIDKDTRDSLINGNLAGYTLVEYGTAVAWSENLQKGYDLVLGSPATMSNYAYRRGEADPIFKDTGTQIQFTNVLVGFSNEQCVPDLAMRPYIILEDAEGEQITIYGGIVERSIGYIAYQNRDSFSAQSEAYNFVWDIIHYVYGDQFD